MIYKNMYSINSSISKQKLLMIYKISKLEFIFSSYKFIGMIYLLFINENRLYFCGSLVNKHTTLQHFFFIQQPIKKCP